MGDHQAEAAEANGEEAQREEDAGHLLPEYAQAYLRTEGAAGAGGRGRDLDEGPQGERPDEQAERLRQGIPVLRRGGAQGGDRVGVERDRQRVVEVERVADRLVLGGRRYIKKQHIKNNEIN